MEAIKSLSVKELRELIRKAGLSDADCIEKNDLQKRAIEAEKRLDEVHLKPGKTPSSPGESRLSSFDCKLINTKQQNSQATNSDFVPIASQLGSTLTKNIACVFPQAPTIDGFTAWWKIDVMQWMGALHGGEDVVAKLIRQNFEGLDSCREQLKQLVGEVKSRYGADKPLIIGGFSQGAMTAMDLALCLEEQVRGVLMLSGAPITVDRWAELLKKKEKLRVFVSHGMSDMVLPHVASTWLRDLLQTNGADIEYHQHPGGHELGPSNVVNALFQFIDRSLS